MLSPIGSVSKNSMAAKQGRRLRVGDHSSLPYFAANQAEALDLEKTVLHTVAEAAEDWKLDQIKGLLGRCNFREDMLDMKVQFLNRGEKERLAFCKSMVTPSTLHTLDEPTNHLDTPSKEMLQKPQGGHVRIGDQTPLVNYFLDHQAEVLQVLDTVEEAAEDW